MGLEPAHQTRIYEDHWHPMEVAFPQEAYGSHFDGFMRHYLTLKTGEIPNVRDVYLAFKAYARQSNGAAQSVDGLVADIHTFADHYGKMALGKETDKDLAAAFQDLRELKVDVAYPFLLELYHDYVGGDLTKDDFIRAVRLVESYVFRRAICSIPTNSLNKTFATFGRELRKDRYLESIEAHLMTLPSYRRFPNDDEFRLELARRDLYNFRSRSYWLRRLENDGRKERVPVDEYTIEHIMPQNENLSQAWRSALGEHWQTVQETWLHTLGNLTLTGYNAEYSDRPFLEKRNMHGGFKESPLRLNEGLAAVESWNEATIRDRAERLSKRASQVWSAPKISAEVIAQLKPKAVKAQEFTLGDHPSVSGAGSMHSLFEALRKEVLALDPCVVEEIVKSYIAYKAETNFLDVVAQAKRLRLSLNMKFHELHDEKRIARDMTNVGHYGNGDVEIAISAVEELPYVMGLVRQAYEKQMADADSAT
jgi:predicted transport protein